MKSLLNRVQEMMDQGLSLQDSFDAIEVIDTLVNSKDQIRYKTSIDNRSEMSIIEKDNVRIIPKRTVQIQFNESN